MRKGAKRVLSAMAFMLAGVGCSVIVGNDVPDFGCSVDAPGVCPTGLHCDVSAKKCVATDGSTPIDEPADDDAGDGPPGKTETGVDADAETGPYALGAACRLDTDCKSKLCGSSTVLTTAIAPTATGPICTSPCCSSADCPSSFVCFNGGTGGSYCVPARTSGRSPGTTGLGKPAGTTCTTATDCRSGFCGTANGETGYSVCIDTCCADTECATGTVCRLGPISAPAPAHTVWICAPMRSTAFLGPGGNCSGGSSECTTNACSGAGGAAVCRPPCSSSESCSSIAGFSGGICIHGTIGTESEAFCLKSTSSGPDPVGTACASGSTCESGYCDQETTQCKNVCARDGDCLASESCRPSAVGTPFLRCVAKPL